MNSGYDVDKQVVCLNDEWRSLNGPHAGELPSVSPQKGSIYTIRAHLPFNDQIFLFFYEIPGKEAFAKEHFRPVKPTSIKSLERFLVNPPKELVT